MPRDDPAHDERHVSPEGKDNCRRLALRVYKDPTAATVSKQLARAVLMLTGGLPR